MIRVLKAIETFVREMNQLIGEFRVLRENGDAVIDGYADGELQRLDDLGKYGGYAAGESQGLGCIRLRQK